MKKFLAILLVTFSSITTVNAASLCSYQDQNTLNQKVANIKPSYDIAEEDLTSESGQIAKVDYINVSILNISEEFYVIVKNDFDNSSKTYRYSDTVNGNLQFRWDQLDKVTNFTIQVYTSSKTGCPNELYKTLYLLTPRRNTYGFSDACYSNPEFELCQKYVKTNNDISEESFRKRLESFENEQNGDNSNKNDKNNVKSVSDKIFDFLNKYGLIILGSSVIIGAGIFIIVINIKKKKQRELGL